ncbi:MAG: hypothetical protein QOI82_1608, partial [Actinomycetota bacterium]|nr:hypothetical protein [Actinomycetota bacterium]
MPTLDAALRWNEDWTTRSSCKTSDPDDLFVTG